jgi:hypothetical protein
MADVDNYAHPLAKRLKDPDLVSVWCTKQHSDQSVVRIDTARLLRPQRTDVVVVRTPSATNYKERINAAVADAAELPPGPVRLELSFVVGNRNWLELWKPTIDALEPLLGRDPTEKRPWHPRDGRITELGMHLTVDPAAGNKIEVGIDAAPLDVPVKAANEKTTRTPSLPAAVPSACADRTIEFRNDDEGYLAWLPGHRDGYVINIAHGYYATAARLHRADCRTINGQNPHGGAWTWPYVKVCAERVAELDHWASDKTGTPIQPCGTCHPR